MKRRSLSVFSLSFIDCICCGLGAIILLFVIANARSTSERHQVTQNLKSEVERMEQEVLEGRKHLVQARNTAEKIDRETVKTQGLSREVIHTIEQKSKETAFYENDTLALKEHINKLKADLQSLEQDLKRLPGGGQSAEDFGSKLRPFPGQGDRQYLTDLKMGGKHIFVLVDVSASMLDETIVGVIRRRNLPESAKLSSGKWRQVVSSVDWLTTQLPQSAKFQIYFFNETAGPAIPNTRNRWLDAADVKQLDEVVRRMKQTVPEKGTSLHNAFEALRLMDPGPDNIFLLTDGLPTMGAERPWGGKVSGETRLRLFDEALRLLPSKVPVNIILYPMEGDPGAASSFWRLATFTGGSFICPSRDWP
ncbi:MAG: VWA domain-containing protein [Desulfobacterota bacterium]|nr:VWA domain-containing protein [Thermodesulfobacteriota bacterium]